MAAIPHTIVTIAAIKAALGVSTNNLSLLVSSPLVNQWSLYKPTKANGSPDWWNYTAGNVSHSILYSPLTHGLDDLEYNISSFWTYQRPTSQYEQGDFRGYNHNAAIAIATSSQPSGDVRWTVPAWKQAINTNSALGISVANFGIQNYYYGILIEWGSSWENKWIQTNSNTIGSGASDIDFNCHMLPFNPAYTGTYRWTSFICSQEITDGTPIRWCTLTSARAAHSGEVVLITPEWGPYAKAGTFTTPYGTITPSSSLHLNSNSGATNSITVNVDPNTIISTSTAENTGDGIFVTIIAGLSQTGDFTLSVVANSANTDLGPRMCQIRISGPIHEVSDAVINVMQESRQT